MATPNQIEANRLNAQRSTGPRSVEGKDTSRWNALKHGIDAQSLILPGEDPDQLAALAERYHQQFHPASATEELLVRSLVLSDWRQQRYARIEAKFIEISIDPALDFESAVAMLFTDKSSPLRLVFQRQQTAYREWTNSLKELQRIQKERKAQEEIEKAKPRAEEPITRPDPPEAAEEQPAPSQPQPSEEPEPAVTG